MLMKLLKIAKTIFQFIGKKAAGALSQTGSLNDKSSTEDINRVIDIFEDYKSVVQEKMQEVEDDLVKEVEYYVEELLLIFEEKEDVLGKYKINPKRIQRKIGRISKDMKGVIERHVSETVSLDNSECRAILKMLPGTKKEDAMQAYMKMTLTQALQKASDKLNEVLADIYDEVNEEVLETMEVVSSDMEAQSKALESVCDEQDEEAAQLLVNEAKCRVYVCEEVEKIVMEG